MDGQINPLDPKTHQDLVDLIRRADFTEALIIFERLINAAYNQGKIDAYLDTLQRLSADGAEALEANIRSLHRAREP